MKLFVGKRPVRLPHNRPCQADDVCKEVSRLNPPFVVRPPDSQPFSVRRRVFLEGAGLRVECEGDGELRLACKLSAEDHNLWQTPADNSTAETEEIERAVEEHMRAPCRRGSRNAKGRRGHHTGRVGADGV